MEKLFLVITLFIISCEKKELTQEQKAEATVRLLLEGKGKYQPISFASFDSLLSDKEKDDNYKMIEAKISEFQDSSFQNGGSNPVKADSFFELSHQWSAKRDSFDKHYRAAFHGWQIIHQYQLNDQTWTDTFYLNQSLTNIDSVKGR